jgi:hypothetical protein
MGGRAVGLSIPASLPAAGGLEPAMDETSLSPSFRRVYQNHFCCLPISPGWRETKRRSDTATALNSLEEKNTKALHCFFPLWLKPGSLERCTV